MDMDGTREKTQKLEDFMKNTEVDKKKAIEILTSESFCNFHL